MSMTQTKPKGTSKADATVRADVTALRVAVRDGWYNAFTDLTWWKQYYWVSFVRGTAHHVERNLDLESGNGVCVILRSNDLRRWRESRIFEPPSGIADGSGCGNAHFCPTPDRLYAFFRVQTPPPTPESLSSDRAMRDYSMDMTNRSWVTWTEDGVHWSKPQSVRLGNAHPIVWRVSYREGTFYSSVAYRGDEEGPFDMIRSDDGVDWQIYSRIADHYPPGITGFSEESALHWLPDGELWCVVRCQRPVTFFRARPPYKTWDEGVNLEVVCDAPVMCTTGGRTYMGGRTYASQADGRVCSPGGTTGLFHLTAGRAELIHMFPAGGDASYAGLTSQEPGKLVMSYYSDAAYCSGQVKPLYHDRYSYKRSASDIYIALLDVGTEVDTQQWKKRISL